MELIDQVNLHHYRVKIARKRRKVRIQDKIYRIAKKTLAFAGCLLYLVCLWMLA